MDFRRSSAPNKPKAEIQHARSIRIFTHTKAVAMMPTYKLALLIAVLLGGLLAFQVAEPFTTGLGNEDVNVGAKFDPVQAASEDRQSLQVGRLEQPGL